MAIDHVPYVLDASLILAGLNRESGGDRLAEFLDEGTISVITYTEVVTKLLDAGATPEAAERSLAELDLPMIVVTEEHARRAAQLRAETRDAGLSLGDRICLATAESLKAAAVTADRAWSRLDVGVEIILI